MPKKQMMSVANVTTTATVDLDMTRMKFTSTLSAGPKKFEALLIWCKNGVKRDKNKIQT
jgi:hypothetical protein